MTPSPATLIQTDTSSTRLPADCVLWGRGAREERPLVSYSSAGIRCGPHRLPVLWRDKPAHSSQNLLNVSATALPLNFRSFAGSRTRICSSLDMFLAGEVTLGSGGQLTAARSIRNPSLSHSESAARECAARSHTCASGAVCARFLGRSPSFF